MSAMDNINAIDKSFYLYFYDGFLLTNYCFQKGIGIGFYRYEKGSSFEVFVQENLF